MSGFGSLRAVLRAVARVAGKTRALRLVGIMISSSISRTAATVTLLLTLLTRFLCNTRIV